MIHDPLLTSAVRNNALWCDAVCRTHGIRGAFSADAWTSTTRTPPLYPDAITLVPDCRIGHLLADLDTTEGCSIKDSYSALDLTAFGFRQLFDAYWLASGVSSSDASNDQDGAQLSWNIVTDLTEFSSWERSWRHVNGHEGVLLPDLLTSEVLVLAGYDGDVLVAGAILNIGAGVVGISNTFAPESLVAEPWLQARRLSTHVFAELSVVGYEQDRISQLLEGHGFRRLHRLRVWIR
jgi:hypothetical protein